MAIQSKLTRQQAAYLQRHAVGRYAHAAADGTVFVTPLCHVVSKGCVYISTEADTRKVADIKPGSRTAFVVDEYFDEWERNRGVQVRGPVAVLRGGAEYQMAKRLHLKKFPQFASFGWDDAETVILKITPERVTAWGLSGRLATRATRTEAA